ncbi:hypothetical protein DBV39_04220 [Orrella marina]|uniref:Uncharacterized protein n=1 Tax=Orrella marina TaxID=2163011 RepID=A0A2R4XH20_9BURK|nr:hypothetical protein DBV39_04220 [Orrella marina]
MDTSFARNKLLATTTSSRLLHNAWRLALQARATESREMSKEQTRQGKKLSSLNSSPFSSAGARFDFYSIGQFNRLAFCLTPGSE